eukprot:COSAG04_NODE_4162_length_2261_cov_8.426457_1_plen_163_part_00
MATMYSKPEKVTARGSAAVRATAGSATTSGRRTGEPLEGVRPSLLRVADRVGVLQHAVHDPPDLLAAALELARRLQCPRRRASVHSYLQTVLLSAAAHLQDGALDVHDQRARVLDTGEHLLHRRREQRAVLHQGHNVSAEQLCQQQARRSIGQHLHAGATTS